MLKLIYEVQNPDSFTYHPMINQWLFEVRENLTVTWLLNAIYSSESSVFTKGKHFRRGLFQLSEPEMTNQSSQWENLCTRGSKFWSSKVCEGGESRGAYACQLNFDPPQFLTEINDHVTQTHFWSAFKLIENLILIQFELMKVDQKWVFEQFIVTWLINCSKTHFWSSSS